MIRLKPLLSEAPGDTMKQGKIDKSGLVVPFNAKKIADLIYNAKGYVSDDEELAKNAIVKNIKNIAQYKQVSAELQKLSDKRGIGQYLQSFMDLSDRLEVVGHLMTVLPKNQWEWTIKKIVPYEDLKYITAGGSEYSKISGSTPGNALASNTATTLITKVYNKEWQGRRTELTKEAIHNLLMTAQIISAPLGGISAWGMALTAAIGLYDGHRYFKEGDPYMGGLVQVFSVLPGMPWLGKQLGIPAAQWTKGFLIGLAKKLAAGSKLTPAEQQVATAIVKNQKLVMKSADDWVSKLIQNNSSKFSKFSETAKQAIRATVSDPKTKLAATLGFYFGVVPMVYDRAYVKLNSVTPEDFMAAAEQDQERVMKQALDDIDRMIAARKQSQQLAQTESTVSNKLAINEVGKIGVAADADILSQILSSTNIMFAATVITSYGVLYPVLKKLGVNIGVWRQMKYVGYWLRCTWGRSADDLQNLKRDFKNKGISISKREYIKIIRAAGDDQIDRNQKIFAQVYKDSLYTAEEALKLLRSQTEGQVYQKYQTLLRKALEELENTAPAKTGANKTKTTTKTPRKTTKPAKKNPIGFQQNTPPVQKTTRPPQKPKTAKQMLNPEELGVQSRQWIQENPKGTLKDYWQWNLEEQFKNISALQFETLWKKIGDNMFKRQRMFNNLRYDPNISFKELTDNLFPKK